MAVKHSGQALAPRWRKIAHNGSLLQNNNYLVRERVKPGRREGFQPWIYHQLSYCCIGLLAFLCYSNSLHGDLVHDDNFAIRANQDLRPSTPWISLLKNDFWGKDLRDNTSHKSYRPLCVLTFRLNYAVHGLSPHGYHLVNVLLHAVTSSLLAQLLHRLVFPARWRPAMAAAAIFAVHPVHTEAVAGVVGRADVLATLLVLLSFLAYTRCVGGAERSFPATRSRLWLALSLVLATAAMLSKETGVTVLGICGLYEILVISASGFLRCWRDKSVSLFLVSSSCKRIIILFLASTALVAARLWVMGAQPPAFTDQDNPAAYSSSILTRVLTYGYLAAFNVWLLLCPWLLSYDWQMDSIPLVDSLLDARNAATLLLLAFLVLLAVKAVFTVKVEEQRMWCCGLLFLVLPFLPASNLFLRVGFVVAERVLYMPSIGYCVLLGAVIDRWVGWCKGRRWVVYFITVLLLTLLSARTVVRNRVWNSRESLFLSGLQTLPYNAKMHYNYANFMKDLGEKDKAIRSYRETLRLWPNHASASNNLGTLVDNEEEAERLYKDALGLSNHQHAGAFFNLGNLQYHQGRHQEALGSLEAAIRLDPACPDVYVSLAVMRENQGDVQGADQMYQKLLGTRDRENSVLRKYAAFLHRRGIVQDSLALFKEAYTKDPYDHQALLEAARILRFLGRINEATKVLNRAVQVDDSLETLDAAGVFHFNTGNTDTAVSFFLKAKRLDRKNPKVKIHLAQALASLSRFQDGLKELEEVLQKDPDNVDAILETTKIYGVTNKHAEVGITQALQLLERALTLTSEPSTRADLLLEKGNHLKDMQQYDQALQAFTETVSIKPNISEAQLNLGVLHHLKGNYALARHHYSEAQILDPNNAVLHKNLAKLNRLERH